MGDLISFTTVQRERLLVVYHVNSPGHSTRPTARSPSGVEFAKGFNLSDGHRGDCGN